MSTRGACILAATITLGGVLHAQDSTTTQAAPHHHYRFIDLGTLGGPHSYGELNGDSFRLLNNSGVVASYADLSTPDPNQGYFCYVADCYQAHAFEWKNGTMTDLGALPVNNNSAGGSINARGWVAGQSQSDVIDPVLGIPEFHAVLWKPGGIVDLGTLPGGTESLAAYVNDSGQVVGFSTVDTTQDPAGFIGFPTHTFIWENGKKIDLGTLRDGADTFPGADCGLARKDEVVGGATTGTAVDPNGIPDTDPFLWDHGKMIDLGSLGGTNGVANCANGRGQIIGQSSLAANPHACGFPVSGAGPGCHAFLWHRGVMTDLGTLGGDNSEAIWLNERGDIAGSADLPGVDLHDAVLWRNGKIHDLGTVDGDACSRGRAINARGQVVGTSTDCHNALHAFVWQDGVMADLNALIQPGTGYQLTYAININDRGEILAKAAPLGFTPNDDEDLGHLALLIPCDDDHAGIDGCDYSTVDAAATAGAEETLRSSRPVSPDASDSLYALPETSVAALKQLGDKGSSGGPQSLQQCILPGRQCNPSAPTCCYGRCLFNGGSTRVGYVCH